MPRLTGFAPIEIPGPRALPFIGVQANAVRLLADPLGQLTALKSDFGDIASLVKNSPAMVCAFGAERNREVLSNAALFENDDEFLLKPPPGSALNKFQLGMVFQTGERHRRHRRLMLPAFQKSAIEGYAADIVAVTEASLRTWPVGQTANIAALTCNLVQYVAVQCLFGLDHAKGDRGVGALARESVNLLNTPSAVLLPIPIPGTPYARLLDTSEALGERLRALIAEKRAQPTRGHDALALIVRARDDQESGFSDDELIGEAATLFVAGHDTQAKTLAWTLFLLDQHPRILADVVDEIDSVLRGAPPRVEDVPKLVLVDRVIKESMRLLASVPVLFIRVCQAEARLGPYTLPRGANVILSPFITHRDPALYQQPARFMPQRWESLQPSIYEYLPFGAGPRMCLGAGFATLALRLMLPMILQRFRLSLSPAARVSRVVRGNILGPRYGMPMQIAPQDRQFARRTRAQGDIMEFLDIP